MASFMWDTSMWPTERQCIITQFQVKISAICWASDVHDFKVLKMFFEVDNIPKGIWSKYECHFMISKKLEANILGKWACMTFAMCYANPRMLFKGD